MAVVKEKIKVTVPEGLTQKGDITVSGKTATMVVTGKTVGAQTVSVSYDGGEAKTCVINVTPKPAFAGEPTASPTAVEVGADSTITQAFNVEGVSVGNVTVTVPAGLTTKTPAAISGKTLTLVVTGKTPGAQKVTLKFGGVTKEVTVTVNPLPVFSGEPTASPATVEVGQDVTITQKFNKAGVKVSSVTLTPSAGLTLKTAAVISGDTLTVVYTGKTAGAQTVGIAYNGTTKTARVTVENKPVIKTVTADPQSVVQGNDSTVTITFE